MSDTPDRARTCEDDGEQHNWVHSSLGIPGFPWLIQCSVCRAYDKQQMQADYERDVAAKEAEIERLRGVNSGLVDDFNSLLVRHSRCDTAVAAAEERGWNAAVEAVISACQADWRFEDHNDWYLAAGAALRKPTEAQT